MHFLLEDLAISSNWNRNLEDVLSNYPPYFQEKKKSFSAAALGLKW